MKKHDFLPQNRLLGWYYHLNMIRTNPCLSDFSEDILHLNTPIFHTLCDKRLLTNAYPGPFSKTSFSKRCISLLILLLVLRENPHSILVKLIFQDIYLSLLLFQSIALITLLHWMNLLY